MEKNEFMIDNKKVYVGDVFQAANPRFELYESAEGEIGGYNYENQLAFKNMVLIKMAKDVYVPIAFIPGPNRYLQAEAEANRNPRGSMPPYCLNSEPRFPRYERPTLFVGRRIPLYESEGSHSMEELLKIDNDLRQAANRKNNERKVVMSISIDPTL